MVEKFFCETGCYRMVSCRTKIVKSREEIRELKILFSSWTSFWMISFLERAKATNPFADGGINIGLRFAARNRDGFGPANKTVDAG